MNIHDTIDAVVKEIAEALSGIDPAAVEGLGTLIAEAKRVFAAGTGRSGLVARAFAMRLMHTGLVTHFVGDVTTPGIEKGDLLFIVSGSGETAGLVAMARKAETLGATIALLTAFPQSSLAKLADLAVRIRAVTPKSAVAAEGSSIQPMGSLFEQSALVFLDALILLLMEKRNTNAEQMFSRHANLE